MVSDAVEYPKHPRHSLLPIVPHASVYDFHFGHPFDPQKDGRLESLKKYGHRLGDLVLVNEPNRELVERIEKETSKRVIPSIVIGLRFGDDPQNPLTFEPDDSEKAWLDYLHERRDDWPWVMASNRNIGEITGVESGWTSIKVTRGFCERWPDLADRFAFAPWDCDIAEHAQEYHGHIDDSPLIKHYRAHRSMLLIYSGHNMLHRDLADANAKGYTTGLLWHHWRSKKEHWSYPFEFMAEFYRALNTPRLIDGGPALEKLGSYYAATSPRRPCCFSGIGFSEGGRAHHLCELIDRGFAGCAFFLPGTIGEKADREMEGYLTDVEE